MHKKLRVAAQVAAAVSITAFGILVGGPASADGSSIVKVELRDACDPATFNAARPGSCVGNGNVTVEQVNADLAAAGAKGELPNGGGAGAWKNNPKDTTINAGTRVTGVNIGGEGHSFTEVSVFGGGCVAPINAALHLSPVTECANPAWRATIVPAGATLAAPPLARGAHKFECLIHPWMRTTITVR